MSTIFKHILDVFSHYLPIPPSLFHATPTIASKSTGISTTSDDTHITDTAKSRVAELVSPSRWEENILSLRAERSWSLKGTVVAPQVTAVPATCIPVIANGNVDQGPEQEHGSEQETSARRDHYIGPDPDTSIDSSFNISLISDTTTSSEDDELIELPTSLTEDMFTPVLHHQTRFELTSYGNEGDDLPLAYEPPYPLEIVRSKNSPMAICGLGISGISNKGGLAGSFDGLGIVGIRSSGKVWKRKFERSQIEDIEEVDEEESHAGVDDQALSGTFLLEIVHTWMDDPFQSHALTSIPECDGEFEEHADVPLKQAIPVASPVQRNEASNVCTSVGSAASENGPNTLVGPKAEDPALAATPRSNPNISAKPKRVTLTRNFSTATVSSSLKRFMSSPRLSSSSLSSIPALSPKLNPPHAPSCLASKRSSPSLPPSPGGLVPRSLTPTPASTNRTRPESRLSLNKSCLSSPVLDKAQPTMTTQDESTVVQSKKHLGIRRSRSLGTGGVHLLGKRVWRV